MNIKHLNAHLSATFQHITAMEQEQGRITPQARTVARACYKALATDGRKACAVKTQVKLWLQDAKGYTAQHSGKEWFDQRKKAYRDGVALSLRTLRKRYQVALPN